jgi:hypothetical protein
MYDMAKRSLAFTVATGGLLLTGTGYAPADAAVGFGSFPGPAQAQGSAVANQASPSSVSTPISVRGPENAARAQAPAAAPAHVRVLTPAAPQGATGAGSSATSTVKHSAGILSGNTVQIPIDLGLNLCSNQADAVAAANNVAGSTCGGSLAPGGSKSGSSATATVSHSGGILSGNTVQAPVNIPLNVCGNQAVAVGLKNTDKGGTCGDSAGAGPNGAAGTGGGSSATAVTDHSGGILSGNIIQAPVNVPVNACGNQANVIAAKNKVSGSECSTGGTGQGTGGGASATAVTMNSGGIGSGLTVQTPIDVPVNACGNQATVIGAANKTGGADCVASGGTASATSATINSGGIASGTSVQTPINVPVNACGNQATVIGVKDTTEGTECTIPGPPSSTTTSVVTNSGGILSGNQPAVPIDVPVNVCGNQASVIGVDNTTGKVECGMPGTPTPTPSTSTSSSPSPSPSSSTPCGACGSPSPSPSSSTPCGACGSPSPSPSSSMPCGACGSPSPSPSSSMPCGACGSPSPSTSASTPPCEACGTPTATPSTTPSHCASCTPPPPTGSPTVMPPPSHPAGPPHHNSLAGTGSEEGLLLAGAGALLLAGGAMRVASKRRTR